MSVANFIQTIWSKAIQDSVEMKVKLAEDCNTKYQGDCKFASTVKILAVGEPTISGYHGEVEYEDMSDASQNLLIAFAEYFGFKVKDIDKAQSVPGLPEKYQSKASTRLAQRRDINIGRLVAGKAITTINEETATYAKTTDTDIKLYKDYFIEKTNSEGKKVYRRVAKPVKDNIANYFEITAGTYETGAENIITASAKTQAAIKTAIDDAIVALRLRNVENGVIDIDPATYSAFKNQLVEVSTNNPEMIRKGLVGMYDDFDVKMSNAIYNDGTYRHCFARTKDAIAFAGQINEVESMRLEGSFSDGVRGLDTYGMKIIAQDELEAIQIPA